MACSASAVLTLASGVSFHLHAGVHTKNRCLRKARVTSVCLAPLSSIVVEVAGEVVYSAHNYTATDSCALTNFKLQCCWKIVIASACGVELPCPDQEWDYIIIGEGAAGSILARFLSDDKTTRVLVLEAGVDHQGDPVVENPDWVPNANTLLYNPLYAVTYPIPIAPLLSQAYSEGTGRGGGSAHNFLQAVIPTPALFDTWVEATNEPMWSYASIAPLIKLLETYTPDGTNPNYNVRGRNGFLNVTQNPPVNIGNPILNQFAASLNIPYFQDYNDYQQGPVGISAVQQFVTPGPNSIRSYADQALLTDGVIVDGKTGNGLNGRKLKILTNASVTNIVFALGGKAIAVKYLYSHNGNYAGKALLSPKGQVILAAGSINTPKILLNSGIGPAEELAAQGIAVVVDSPQVGKNLQNQYGTEFVMTGAVPNSSQLFFDFHNQNTRAIQVTAISLGPVTAYLPALLNPTSRGQITLVSSNPQTQPKVEIGFYQTPKDISDGVNAFKLAKEVSIKSGQVLIFPPPEDFPAPYGPAPDDSLLIKDLTDPRYFILQSHIVGTCRMGKQIADAVVDGRLRVFGTQNVLIADNSVEPIITDGNTCYPAYLQALNLLRFLGVLKV